MQNIHSPGCLINNNLIQNYGTEFTLNSSDPLVYGSKL